MKTNESIEGFVEGLFEIPLDECTFEDLCRITRVWIEFVKKESLKLRDQDSSADTPFDRLTQFFVKRHFVEFRAQVKTRSPLELAFFELFLLSRIRTYVLAYLSVQEGEDFEGVNDYETNAPTFISELLRYLGKSSNCTLNLGYKKLRIRFDFDPLIHLRKIYKIHLISKRQKRETTFREKVLSVYHKAAFSFKSKVVAFVIRLGTRKLVKQDRSLGIRKLLQRSFTRKYVALCILILFPSAKTLSESDWSDLLRRIEDYFAPQLANLLAAMPDHSLSNHGLIKLCKVAFGTIVGRTSVRSIHEKNTIDFIFNTLRVAFSWGVTYPLVDNVLDSAMTNDDTRADLIAVLSNIFAQQNSSIRQETLVLQRNASVREVYQRLTEVISLIPVNRRHSACTILRHLLESHHRDSKRRLSVIANDFKDEFEIEVMVDTALKSALVRLGTMEVCGITIDNKITARNLVRSLFNQLGDDLWDIYEDYDDDRVTPFTLFLTRGGSTNPFEFYLNYSKILAMNLSKRRKTAVFLGFCESLRDSQAMLRQRKDDHLGVTNAIADIFSQPDAGLKKIVSCVPHVDFDAVLFAFEKALLDIILHR